MTKKEMDGRYFLTKCLIHCVCIDRSWLLDFFYIFRDGIVQATLNE